MLSESLEHQCEIKTDSEAEEERVEKIIKKDPTIPETEKETLVKSRKGQGKFRNEVLDLHISCPFTGVTNPIFVRERVLSASYKSVCLEATTHPLLLPPP